MGLHRPSLLCDAVHHGTLLGIVDVVRGEMNPSDSIKNAPWQYFVTSARHCFDCTSQQMALRAYAYLHGWRCTSHPVKLHRG